MISEQILEKFPVLTEEVFENILKQHENDDAFKIISVTGSDIGAIGDHFASLMFRIKIEYRMKNDEGTIRILPLLAKTLPEGTEMKKVVMEVDAFPTEMKMFGETLPKLQEFLNTDAKKIEFGARAYYINKEKNTLVLEDLAPKGFVMGDRRRGLDMKHCKLVLETIAKFHATSVALHVKDPESVECYTRNAFDLGGPDTPSTRQVIVTLKNLADVVEKWPENGKIYAEKLRKRADSLMPDVKDALTPKAGSFNVLNHADLWVTNLLFRYSETTGEVEDIRFVDYQISYYTSPAMDLQYFIQISLEDDDRRGRVEELLKIYHRQLSETLGQLGYADKVITFQELLKEYERLDVFGLYIIIFELPMMISSPEDVYDFELGLTNQSDLNSMHNRLTNDRYTRIIKKLLPVYVERGVL